MRKLIPARARAAGCGVRLGLRRAARVLVLLLVSLAAAAPGPEPPISREQAAQALTVLENQKSRDAFIATLKAIVEASPAPAGTTASGGAASGGAASGGAALQGAAAKAATPTGKAAPAKTQAAHAAPALRPNGLGADLLVSLSRGLAATGKWVAAQTQAMVSLPLLSIWIASLWNSPYLQQQLASVGWRFLVVIGGALVAEWLAIRAIRVPRASLVARARRAARKREGSVPPLPDPVDEGEARAEAGETEFGHAAAAQLLRSLFAVAGLALELVPVLVFVAVAYGLLASGMGGGASVGLVVLAVANAYAVARILLSLVRMVVGAECGLLRVVPVSDGSARYALLWARRIVGVSVFGYIGSEVAELFGLYDSLHLALMKLVMLVVHLMLIVIVLQQRRNVALLIRAPKGARGPAASVRNLIAVLWHWVVIFYLIGLWFVWAVGVQNRFHVLVRFGVVTAIVIALAWLINRVLWRVVERRVRIAPDLAERLPGLERRARHYLSGLRSLIAFVVGIVAFIVLLQLWGIGAISWFASGSLGVRVVSAAVVIGITVLVALFTWEVANVAIERHLARLSREGQAARSARLRTLLPILRTSLLIAIGVLVALMVLSELGLNIAPLLASAGVIGIAIGFGSQKLVQDVINGLFLLFENAMQVGDVVSLGGMSGVVENLSVRTIRLRDSDGSVHLVPFSAVTTVTNRTRDFGYAVFNVGVAYKEDVDHVIEVLKEIAHEMREAPEWAPMVRDELEVWGLDQFGASAVVIACRLRTGPAQRWAVGREFNRRMKRRFDELGIEMPYPTQKLVLDQPVPPYLVGEGGALAEVPRRRAVP
ncbi:MAG: mechanosensitive ion channel domain-containing protein [Acetobacteraceae bacterium]